MKITDGGLHWFLFQSSTRDVESFRSKMLDKTAFDYALAELYRPIYVFATKHADVYEYAFRAIKNSQAEIEG
ncbi:MAG: hypothetical protein NUV49_04285 [Patescibacteria group bacterium]|nr:hypothetical protein [Patescibacteria group bacterium]